MGESIKTTARLHEFNLSTSKGPMGAYLEFAFKSGGNDCVISLTRAEVTSSWIQGLIETIADSGVVRRDHPCRIERIESMIVAVGHVSKSRWFAFEPLKWGGTPCARAAKALAHVNDYRRAHTQRLLDPDSAAWTADDVVTEAKRLGWLGS